MLGYADLTVPKTKDAMKNRVGGVGPLQTTEHTPAGSPGLVLNPGFRHSRSPLMSPKGPDVADEP